MTKMKSVGRIEILDKTPNYLRRSPRLVRHNECLLSESFKNPNLKSAGVPRRSPRIGKLGDANSLLDPKTPNLESVGNHGRLPRRRRVMSPPSCEAEKVNEGAVEVRQKEEVRNSIVSEPKRSPRLRESCSEQLVGSTSAVFVKTVAEVKTTIGPESSGKEKVGLRRSPRLSSQQNNYKDADQELDSVLDEICENDGGSSDQRLKRSARKINSHVGSEQESSHMGEDPGCENECKEDEPAKRKRKRGKGGNEVVRGWTKEQEMALERAYMAMKPTPRFWKKVSKMVGKSAQECFDRINYNQHTPVPPRIRSRIKMKTPPPVSGCSLSASKLLVSPKQTRKRKTQLGQKKVRKLLQKQCYVEKEPEGDLFSVLEGNMSSPLLKVSQQSLGAFTPPAISLGNGSNIFSARKNSASRLGKAALLISPPVLKQVKNKALHEKYIDQLHSREAKRKAELTRAKKTTFGKENLAPTICNQKPNIVKAAKDALESDARDVILQFQRVQSKALNNIPSDTEDDTRLSSDKNDDDLSDGGLVLSSSTTQ